MAEMLKLDFYESGMGETILIQMPSGGLGIIDAAAPSISRPSIGQLVNGRHIHFACLTHPHLDHGEDLVPLLQSGIQIDEFWHTIGHLPSFVFQATEANGYPTNLSELILEQQVHWTDFLVDLYAEVLRRRNAGLIIRVLHGQRDAITIDGVDFYFLGPDEDVIQRLSDITSRQFRGEDLDLPDLNDLSAVIYIKYGNSGVLLCSDAPKKVWVNASAKIARCNLARVQLLKIPHHGSRDALNFRNGPRQRSYLQHCLSDQKTTTILFAGDSKHPNLDVYKKVKEQSKIFCVSNGLKKILSNSLNIDPDEGEEVTLAPPCIPHIQVELLDDGTYRTVPSVPCSLCV